MRTLAEVQQLKIKIEADLKYLPDNDTFGDSNAEAKEDLRRFIRDLMAVSNQMEKYPHATAKFQGIGPEVKSWFDGKDDYYLGDYLK